MGDEHHKGEMRDHSDNKGDGRISDPANSSHQPQNPNELPTLTTVMTASQKPENKSQNCVDSNPNLGYEAKTYP